MAAVFACNPAFGACLYVSNGTSGSITVVNIELGRVTRAIPVRGYTTALAASHDGTRLYGSVVGETEGTLTVIDVRTASVIRQIPVGRYPIAVALNTTDSLSCVSNSLIEGNLGDSISVIDTQSFETTRLFQFVNDPRGLVIAPDGRTLYVASSLSSEITVLDILDGGERDRVPTTRHPYTLGLSSSALIVLGDSLVGHSRQDLSQIYESPDLFSTYIGVNDLLGRAYVGNPFDPVLEVIDPASGESISAIPLPSGALGIAQDPLTSRAYVAHPDLNTVSEIDLATESILRTFKGVADPSAIAFSNSGEGCDPLCPGDCDADGTTSVDEIVRAVSVTLDDASVASCQAADRDGAGSVTIDELILAIGSLLNGCSL